jgi:propanol-preferring alcohol dehydrogenase
MRAWIISPDRRADQPMRRVERPDPEPGPGQVRVRINCCGVCRTDVHLVRGDLAPRRPGVIPGHEAIGEVDVLGPGARRFEVGDRVGVPWLGHADHSCRFCIREQENLCVAALFTGWDLDGGYADYCLVDELYAYRIPDAIDDERAAPLMCAGIIGYRALRSAAVAGDGSIGIYGFGASGHLAAQIALHEGLRVHVFTRAAHNQLLAKQLGVHSVNAPTAAPPEPLDGAMLFAPAGELVPVALRALDRGGTLAVAGIWLSQIPPLNYDTELFGERRLCSVTANTRHDGETFIQLADRYRITSVTRAYPMDAAPAAVADVGSSSFSGAAVLHN